LNDGRSVLVGEQRNAYGGRILRLLGGSRTDGKTQPPDGAAEQKVSTFHEPDPFDDLNADYAAAIWGGTVV
jgi:hypothetical protein